MSLGGIKGKTGGSSTFLRTEIPKKDALRHAVNLVDRKRILITAHSVTLAAVSAPVSSNCGFVYGPGSQRMISLSLPFTPRLSPAWARACDGLIDQQQAVIFFHFDLQQRDPFWGLCEPRTTSIPTCHGLQ